MIKDKSILKIVFFVILTLQFVIVVCLPLIHLMNDSGWYLMNVHYLNTGEYITESRYPSFNEPSLYYPFFGYSLFLYICEKIHHLTGLEFASIVKYLQFLIYALSGILVQKLVFMMTNKQNLAYVIGILFLLYYPYFNYVNLVMSETYATFLILLTAYYFLKAQKDQQVKSAIILFLLAGYIVLVKPVFLPISATILLFYILSVFSVKKYKLIACTLIIFVFPIIQIVFNAVQFKNPTIQTGYGWHIWDRVISYDKQIPQNSIHLKQLKQIYKENNRPVSYGYWWDVTKDLSEFGFTEIETQKICEDVARDGIKEKPLNYFLNTFRNSYRNFITNNTPNQVYSEQKSYEETINAFALEPQHQPLTKRLLKQFDSEPTSFAKVILKINTDYANYSSVFNNVYHNIIVFSLYVLVGLHNLFFLLKSRFKRYRNETLLWFIAFSIIFGSNLAEYPQVRLMQPAVIFILISIALKCNELYEKKTRRVEQKNV